MTTEEIEYFNKHFRGKTYDEVFVSVRQRTNAFRVVNENGGIGGNYGKDEEADYLEEAYRFLYTTFTLDNMQALAKNEGMSMMHYMIGLSTED